MSAPPAAPLAGPVALFALAGLATALACAPGITWLDAGELGAAAAELGVAHPPGFPLFALIHKAVMLLVPFGGQAFRGNLASGLLGGLALALGVRAAQALGVAPRAALVGLALVGLTPLWALHSLTIEVYTGAAAWLALVVLWVARAARTGDGRPAVAAAFAVGLALGHHAELRLFAVALLPGALWFGRRRGRVVAAGAGAGLAGALVALYLPLRAQARPWRNWGDPSDLGGLWDHLSGARIRAAFADRFGAVDADALGTFGLQLAEGAPFLLALGVIGCALLARQPGGWLVGAAWATDVIYATVLNPMGLRDLQNGVPGLLALGLGAGACLSAVTRRLPLRPAAQAVAGGALLVAAAAVGLPGTGRSDDRGLGLILDGLADGVAVEGLALVVSDHYAAGLAWRQVVEGDRPDVAVVVRQHAWDPSSLDPVRRRLPRALAGWSPAGGLGSIAGLAAGWPLQWEWAAGADAAHRPADLSAAFPFTARSQADARRYISASDAVALAVPGVGLDHREAQQAFSDLVADQGHSLLVRGDAAGAAAAFEMALTLEPEASRHLNNAAQAWLRAGRLGRALEHAHQAHALAPHQPLSARNFARMLLAADRPAAAVEVLQALPGIDRDAEALALRGVARANLGDLVGAAADWRAALRQDPRQAEAAAGLRRLGAAGPR